MTFVTVSVSPIKFGLKSLEVENGHATAIDADQALGLKAVQIAETNSRTVPI